MLFLLFSSFGVCFDSAFASKSTQYMPKKGKVVVSTILNYASNSIFFFHTYFFNFLCIHLFGSIREREKVQESTWEKPSIHWFIPHMAAVAYGWIKWKPGASPRTAMWEAGAQTLGVFPATFPSHSWNLKQK